MLVALITALLQDSPILQIPCINNMAQKRKASNDKLDSNKKKKGPGMDDDSLSGPSRQACPIVIDISISDDDSDGSGSKSTSEQPDDELSKTQLHH